MMPDTSPLEPLQKVSMKEGEVISNIALRTDTLY